MYKFRSIYILLLFQLWACALLAGFNEPKSLEATRTEVKPVIDGFIDEVFLNSPFKASDFTTLNPTPGLPSAYKTEVSIIYDDQSIFIAAKMYDDPDKMIKDLSPRDALTNTGYFGVTIDPYKTGLSGFTFTVSAAGVQRDAKNTIQDEDESWNEVWKSAVQILEDGWSVEMAIPYSAIRFPTKEISEWNINFTRSVRRTREESFWNPIDPEVNGFLSQMGTLKNIKNIDSPLRLSLTPYVGTSINTFVNQDGNQDVDTRFAGGVDLKYGINDAFTLDMILIPDFSQVRSDVLQLNLTPFEQRFDENRPFFTEGLELFQTANVFYTRRIGGNGHLQGQIRNQDDFGSFKTLPKNNLINASKISGRTQSNTGIGVFNAIEGATMAQYQTTTDSIKEALLNPMTNYNVIVVEQALKNNSKIAFINTNVLRVGEYTDANVFGTDWNLRTNRQTYDTQGSATISKRFIEGSGIDLGFKVNASVGKIQGAWNYRLGTNIESDRYNPNDLGFLFSPNEKTYFTEIQFNKFKPKNEKIAQYNFTQTVAYQRLYAPDKFTGVEMRSRIRVRLKTFTTYSLYIGGTPLGVNDYFEPRTADFSQFLSRPRSVVMGGFISTDYSKPVAIDIDSEFRKFDLSGKYEFNINFQPRLRLSSKVFVVPKASFSVRNVDRGRINPRNFLHANDDIFIGGRQVQTFNNGLSGQYNINNKMSIDVQLNHFFSTVKYSEYGLLEEDGNVTPSEYLGIDEDGNSYHDINFNFFTINTVYTWRFAPGSDLVVSYKSDLQRNSPYATYFRNVGELSDFYRYGGLNVKALYFLDMNKLGKFLL